MLNIIWPIFIIISYIYAIITGNIEKVNVEIFNSVNEAVSLSINLLGAMCLWCGIMKIAQNTNLIIRFTKLLNPIMNWLFPELKENKEAKEQIAMNMTANILGIGNASTPLGLKAMETLQKDNKDKERLSDSMAMLIVLNTASLQIIPTTIIAIRVSLESKNPTSIIVPVWIATICAAIAGVISVKLFIAKEQKRQMTIKRRR
ncbi:MAG: nucleoside recognition protein [Clostridia bacterium]|nr:nucleoside recognition protein [Clostridia bacterium]